VSKERKMEIYERSRQRNHSHNVSASSSLAWAHRSLGDGGMASTHGVPNQESKINCAWPNCVADCIRSAIRHATDGLCGGDQQRRPRGASIGTVMRCRCSLQRIIGYPELVI